MGKPVFQQPDRAFRLRLSYRLLVFLPIQNRRTTYVGAGFFRLYKKYKHLDYMHRPLRALNMSPAVGAYNYFK